MTLEEFHESLSRAEPPASLDLALAGLWWDAKGDWGRAHESAQQDEGKDASWVHAYLHRKEGDQGNTAYLYNRAGMAVCPGNGRCGVGQHYFKTQAYGEAKMPETHRYVEVALVGRMGNARVSSGIFGKRHHFFKSGACGRRSRRWSAGRGLLASRPQP